MQSLPEVISNLHSDAGGLNDFTAYLSKNHCLETLQFTQDAWRYRAHYAEIVEDKEIPWEYLRRHYDYLQELWEDLLGTYILPSGHREVNLPSEVRARLLGLRSSALPPHPSELDEAVKIIIELMEDSILPGFLKSYVSLDQPGDRGGGGWRGIFGRLQRKIPTPTSERGYEDSGSRASGSREDGEVTLCTRRRFLRGAPASSHNHLLRPLGELFDHTVRRVRGMRWLKPPQENDGAADSEIDAKDEQFRAKLLE
ncbi:RGS domain-containing protein [Fusarium oxysporum]|nr:RGS domain-containing protein [Fusarium oxysporum]